MMRESALRLLPRPEPFALAGRRVLVLGLGEEPVDPDVERRIVEQAGGNPLFAEQLVAFAREAPAEVAATPPTVEALLASRLDRLAPRQLSVLRRAAVVGRRFTRPELADLTPHAEVVQSERQLADLVERSLVHAREHVFAFHHVLVRDVAYRGIPKADRAELHELAARGLDRRNGADELVGYHFEQAHRYISELVPGDERAGSLGLMAGERLGRAGIRAWKRGDIPAAVNLLSRAVDLKPDAYDLACELALALNVLGDRARGMEVLRDALGRADGHHRVRVDLEQAHLRSLENPEYARTLVEAATRAVPVGREVRRRTPDQRRPLEHRGDRRFLLRRRDGVAVGPVRQSRGIGSLDVERRHERQRIERVRLHRHRGETGRRQRHDRVVTRGPPPEQRDCADGQPERGGVPAHGCGFHAGVCASFPDVIC